MKKPFRDVAEFAEYSEAAAKAAERLMNRINGDQPWALSYLFMNRNRPVVVAVARDEGAVRLAEFMQRGGIADAEAVPHDEGPPEAGEG